MITIYVSGCSTCGVNAVYIRRVRRYAAEIDQPVTIKNSLFDGHVARQEHLTLLKSLNLDNGVDQYDPIVVEDGEVTKLREWKR